MASKLVKVEKVLKSPVRFGEGPFWSQRSQTLYFVDYMDKTLANGHVCAWSEQAGDDSTANLETRVSFVIPVKNTNETEFVVGCHNRINLLDWKTSKVTEHSLLNPDGQGIFVNDAKCDAEGRLWTGTYKTVSATFKTIPKAGSLYTLDKGHLKVASTGINLSNGIAWSPDNKIMYFVDTDADTVDAFDYDIQNGAISNRRAVIKYKALGSTIGLTEGAGADGITTDVEGTLWVTGYSTGKIVRFDTCTGKILQQIQFPCSSVTSCCFGGRNLSDLYVTSGRIFLSDEELASQPDAGQVFRVTGLGVKGVPSYEYAKN